MYVWMYICMDIKYLCTHLHTRIWILRLSVQAPQRQQRTDVRRGQQCRARRIGRQDWKGRLGGACHYILLLPCMRPISSVSLLENALNFIDSKMFANKYSNIYINAILVEILIKLVIRKEKKVNVIIKGS